MQRRDNMTKGIFHGLLIATPLAALVLYFSLAGKEEVKQEQHLQQAVQELDKQKFDDEFADAWKKPPPGTAEKRKARISQLETDVAHARARRDGLDQEFDDMRAGMKQTLHDEDVRLGNAAASSVKSARFD